MRRSQNMRLLAHHGMNGFGNCGEGMVIQLARDGRRVLWLAHESPPKNVTALDVTDPRKPSVIVQTDLPHAEMRSNSLDLAGDLLVVAYQTSRPGMAAFQTLLGLASGAHGPTTYEMLYASESAR